MKFKMNCHCHRRRAFHFAAISLLMLESAAVNALSSRMPGGRRGNDSSNGSRSSSSSSSKKRNGDNTNNGEQLDRYPTGERRRRDSSSSEYNYDHNDDDGYNNNNKNDNNYNGDSNYNYNVKGRSRYSSNGRKKERSIPPSDNKYSTGRGRGSRNSGRSRGRGRTNNRGHQERQQDEQQHQRPPVPSLISRPTYFTCRHTYESCLREEIMRSLVDFNNKSNTDANIDENPLLFSKPHPGLVLVSSTRSNKNDYNLDDDRIASFLGNLRPTYALQTMPNCKIVKAESIKGLANAVLNSSILVSANDNKNKNVVVGGTNTNKNMNGILKNELMNAPKGSLAIHALVPEMGRGMPEEKLPQYRRATKISDEIAAQLRKRCKAARNAVATSTQDYNQNEEKWLLQIMLLEPQIVAASLTKCNDAAIVTVATTSTAATATSQIDNNGDINDDVRNIDFPSSRSSSLTTKAHYQTTRWTWPNWYLPAGLALVDIEKEQQESDITVPSSAYRKLLEAFWYMGERPPQTICEDNNNDGNDQGLLLDISSPPPVIDLGASPGGWTAALRLMGCKVMAIDRSPLDPTLMQDTGVEYVQGDAFRFVPPWARNTTANDIDNAAATDTVDAVSLEFTGCDKNRNINKSNSIGNNWPGLTLKRPFPDTWMISDIIAYPDRIIELLDGWCGKQWVSHAIVTIKFQSEIPWEEVQAAKKIVTGYGYSCRTVHFFNNKNEVTFLAVKDGYSTATSTSKQYNNILLGKPMYSPILPKPKKKS